MPGRPPGRRAGRPRDIRRNIELAGNALPAVVVFAAVVGLAFENGGFFPSAWTTAAVALLWVTALALLFADRLELRRSDVVWLGLLAALLGWTALSAAWSLSRTESLLEVRRGLIYLAALGAVVLLVRRRSDSYLLAAVWAAASLVVAYALVRYLFAPKVRPDEFEGNLLFRPLGYANALGILAGIGAILSVAFAARAPTRTQRMLAAASVAPLAAAVYLTGSRASALAAAVGLATMVAVDRHRLQPLGIVLVFVPVGAAVVALSAHSRLTDPSTVGHAAERQARLLALWIVLGAVALVLLLPTVEKVGAALVCVSRRRRALAGTALAAAGVVGVAFVGADWVDHFFTTGYRPTYWHVAWREYVAHPWLGSGAGTFGDYWLRYGNPGVAGGALDAHNLYLETLAEVGPIGLALLASTLALPLVSALRASGRPLTSAAAGAYAAFLSHAALDWDWEMPAVTLAALACAAAAVVAAGEGLRPRELSARARGGALALTLALALFALAGQFLPGLGGSGP